MVTVIIVYLIIGHFDHNLHDACTDHCVRSLVTVVELTMMTIMIHITVEETWRSHISKILSQLV